MASTLAVSILDAVQPAKGIGTCNALQGRLQLAKNCERYGYSGYWFVEHHANPDIGSACPAVLMAAVAAATRNIAVGSAGIMLPNHPPLAVAEWYNTLAALFPGRVNLGLGRAPGTSKKVAAMLGRRTTGEPEDLESQLAELLRLLDGEHDIAVSPGRADQLAVPFVLGAGRAGARLAAATGLPFIFAHHINPRGCAEAIDLYRMAFRPSDRLERPRAMVSVMAVAARTAVDAELVVRQAFVQVLKMRISSGPAEFPSKDEASTWIFDDEEQEEFTTELDDAFVGDAVSVANGLDAFACSHSVDELLVTSVARDFVDRDDSYRLIARELGIGSRDLVAPTADSGSLWHPTGTAL